MVSKRNSFKNINKPQTFEQQCSYFHILYIYTGNHLMWCFYHLIPQCSGPITVLTWSLRLLTHMKPLPWETPSPRPLFSSQIGTWRPDLMKGDTFHTHLTNLQTHKPDTHLLASHISTSVPSTEIHKGIVHLKYENLLIIYQTHFSWNTTRDIFSHSFSCS